MAINSRFSHEKWWFSLVMLNYCPCHNGKLWEKNVGPRISHGSEGRVARDFPQRFLARLHRGGALHFGHLPPGLQLVLLERRPFLKGDFFGYIMTCPTICGCNRRSISVYIYINLYLYLYLSMYVCIYLSIYLSINMYIYNIPTEWSMAWV